MKKRNWILTVIVVIACATNFELKAQEITVPEPEFINSAIYVEDNEVQRLEKAIPYDLSRRTIASYATGVHASKSFKQVKGNASGLRLPLKDSYSFIVRVTSNAFDPFEEIAIIRMESSRSNRKYNASSFDMLGQAKSGDLDYVSFYGTKYGESSYLIQIDQPLEPGEYAIQLRRASDVLNCFGIGPVEYEQPEEDNTAASSTARVSDRPQKQKSSSSFSTGYQALIAGDIAFHGGIGINELAFPFILGADFMVTDDIGIGAELNYFSFSDEYYSYYDTYTIDYKATAIGIRGTYHLMNLFDIANPQADLYGGIFLGYANLKAESVDGFEGEADVSGYGIFVGGRYMFNEQIGLMGELGYGVTFLKLGLTIKL